MTALDIAHYYHQDEQEAVEHLLAFLNSQKADLKKIDGLAKKIVEQARLNLEQVSGFAQMVHAYDISTQEGLALMCLAEALLRIPDQRTAIDLIHDKLSKTDWKNDQNQKGLLTQFSAWGLNLTQKIVQPSSDAFLSEGEMNGLFANMLAKVSAPFVKEAIMFSMKILGEHFVLGSTIDKAFKRGKKLMKKMPYNYSFDMLGEAARTADHADHYFQLYSDAIAQIGQAQKDMAVTDIIERSGISIKLSALEPVYDALKFDEAVDALTAKLKTLTLQARDAGISLCVDAEESYRLDMSLEIIRRVHLDPDLADYNGFGFALQAYQKRAFHVVDWIADLAKESGKRLVIRLVKGAYWDTEIKYAQVEGFDGYPVFTRKASTDISYMACAHKMINYGADLIYAQFATHNAHTIAYISQLKTPEAGGYEFQRLHGMGDEIYHTFFDDAFNQGDFPKRVRIYAPVGTHADLLPYLVRRLLENGANSSFIHQMHDKEARLDHIVEDPRDTLRRSKSIPHDQIALPANIYGHDRVNSRGKCLDDRNIQKTMQKKMKDIWEQKAAFEVFPMVDGVQQTADQRLDILNPSTGEVIGKLNPTSEAQVKLALDSAEKAFESWSSTPTQQRADCLDKMANLMEAHYDELLAILIMEAGKVWADAVAEVREAVDFCRYYATQARTNYSAPIMMPGPTGESNQLSYHGRGIFVCISPWNFPLAIFLGQVSAALVTGNCVITKPAEDTSLIAQRTVELLYEAGIPKKVLQFTPGKGSRIGPALVPDPRVAGVAFTGSTGIGQWLNLTLAQRENAQISPLIAETGGQNAMIVDSSALTEQVVDDVIMSCFRSAGQRCSALRILFLQEDVADKTIEMLKGAARLLTIGDPKSMGIDIGPVIHESAKKELEAHIKAMKKQAKKMHYAHKMPEGLKGSFVGPHIFELEDVSLLTQEHFGPILHIVRYKAKDFGAVIDEINGLGFGLTCGLHSRIESHVTYFHQHIKVGNSYVNRNMIGAVVGVQPFGGEGFSGTGPKAGGPSYLGRFMAERVLTIDTTASGGNATLVNLS